MPIHNIQTNEYECGWCHYKWINRFNGKDQPIPKNCAKCKRLNWVNPEEKITPYKRKLRNKIRRFNKLYQNDIQMGHSKPDDVVLFPTDLPEKFLNINPRPTRDELEAVIKPLNWDVHINKHCTARFKEEICFIPSEYAMTIPEFIKHDSCWVPYPKHPGYHMVNFLNQNCEWSKMLLYEAEARIQKMVEIMKSRGIDYDPAPAIQRRKEEYLLEVQRFEKEKRSPENIQFVEEIIAGGREFKKRLKIQKSEQTKRWWANRR